jgi:hypothetical protein
MRRNDVGRMVSRGVDRVDRGAQTEVWQVPCGVRGVQRGGVLLLVLLCSCSIYKSSRFLDGCARGIAQIPLRPRPRATQMGGDSIPV